MCYNYIGEIMSKKKVKNIKIDKKVINDVKEENQVKSFFIIL